MTVELGGLDEAHDVGGTLACAQGAGKQPIRSPEEHRPDSVFEVVVVYGQIANIEIADQRCPPSSAVIYGLRRRGAIRDLTALSGQPLPE